MSDLVITPKPILSGTASTVVGAIAVGVSALVGVLPAPWGGLAGVVGVILATLAGVAAPASGVTDGKPVLQGTALTIALALAAGLESMWGAIPDGWPQSVALSVMAIAAWLTGKSMPALGNPNAAKARTEAELAASAVHDKASAIAVLASDDEKTPTL
jgi:hypothetical protein